MRLPVRRLLWGGGLLCLLAGCTSVIEKSVVSEPPGEHSLDADRADCLAYAQRYGVIDLGPLMGDQSGKVFDRRRRDLLFLRCMESRGYRY